MPLVANSCYILIVEQGLSAQCKGREKLLYKV